MNDSVSGRVDLLANLRRLQDRLADGSGPDQLDRSTAQILAEARDRYGPPPALPSPRGYGLSNSPADHDQVLVPHFAVTAQTPETARGIVRFSRSFIGQGAVHGGAITLLFDDILGRLVHGGGLGARTAQLNVRFCNLTPLDEDLEFVAAINDATGRKLWMSIELRHASTLLATGEGLWILPRTGATEEGALRASASGSQLERSEPDN